MGFVLGVVIGLLAGWTLVPQPEAVDKWFNDLVEKIKNR